MLDSFKGSKPKSNRVKFQMTDTTTLVVENEYCKIYNDTRSGKPFKVINDEVVPLELRELNMWKNRQKNPSNFNVEIIKDENGIVSDYVISRIAAPNAAQPAGRPTPPTPSAQTASASRPTPPTSPAPPAAASTPTPQTPASASKVKAVGGGTTTRMESSPKPSRIKFEPTPTTV